MSTRNSKCSLKTDINLVEQILEQGQRLRSAMVQTILNNDPFNADVLKTKSLKSYSETNTLKPMHSVNIGDKHETKSLTLEDKHRFLAYLRGEQMTRNDERKVLDTFRIMSNADICDATERSYTSDYSCCCDTCKAYYKHNLSCDFNHSSSVLCKDRYNVPHLDLNKNPSINFKTKDIGSTNIYTQAIECLKYVDSLKIAVHSLLLNQEGNKKVYGSSADKKLKLPTSISHTYFIEYQIPESITKLVLRSKSKVDTGLDSHNLVRMCSKKLHNEAIYFKQISLHDIINLNEIDLSAINIKFQVSCRTLKQKSSNILGYAMFNMASFLNCKNLSLNQELLVMLNGEAPIVIGTLKISMQLGCGQLYFGKEFIEAIYANKENITQYSDNESNIAQSETKHVTSEATLISKEAEFSDENYEIVNKKKSSTGHNLQENNIEKSLNFQVPPDEVLNKSDLNTNRSVLDAKKPSPNKDKNSGRNTITTSKTDDLDRQVLFGFICVGEAQFSNVKDNTFVTCQPFCQDDVLYSRLIHCSSNPYYNFNQVLPFVYDDHFLNKLRDNYMVFEFWEKINDQNNLIGICKVPLHQFYVAFRNPVITKYLNRNKLPVIGCDRWEPICNPLTGEIYGQTQVLVALGADVQIHNLRLERGFESEAVTSKLPRSFPIVSNKEQSHKSAAVVNSAKLGPKELSNQKKSPTKNKSISAKSKSKKNLVDVAIQSDLNMGDSPNGTKTTAPQNTDVLGAFLAQLLQQRQKSFVENSTNTEDKQNVNIAQTHAINDVSVDNLKIRKTSDLLDSLQQALSLRDAPQLNSRDFKRNDTFKAHVVIENALHLPSRTKCSVKMAKGKPRFEELMPSPYVSFETDTELKVTKVVQDNKNPDWDYSCDVDLSTDFLTNSQKRLIFKVWKKSTNISPFEPNFESDTVLGFAALDLTVLLAGMPTISGWFNIVDFSNKCNGQIKITVTPLENLNKFVRHRIPISSIQTNPESLTLKNIRPDVQINKVEEPGELLSRALKRKFTELDEITQRLKLRLSHVTNEESDASTDDLADEFERDINTLCVEDDYDMINFTEETGNMETQDASNALLQIQNSNFIYANDGAISALNFVNNDSSNPQAGMDDVKKISDNSTAGVSLHVDTASHGLSSIGAVSHLDKQLMEGRQKIDSLLEKLSLLNHNEAEIFNNRYVSGCSAKPDCSKSMSDDILKDICKDLDPISTDVSSENSAIDLHTTYKNKQTFDVGMISTSSNSEPLTQYSERRLAPDGAGNTPDDKSKSTNIAISSTDT